MAKKSSGIRSVNFDQALDLALCNGWIDGQGRSLDTNYHIRRFTPRRPKSLWSQRNVSKAEKLIADGRMTAAGFAQIDAAKKDGRWDKAYAGPKTITVPKDLEMLLKEKYGLWEVFEAQSSQVRYMLLLKIHTAMTPKLWEKRTAAVVKIIENMRS